MTAWNDRIGLVERLGACVVTDMKGGAAFPTDHPAHTIAPLSGIGGAAAQKAFRDADVILSLDWIDLEGALGPLAKSAKVIHVSMDYTLHNGSHANHMSLPAVDVLVASTSDEMVTDLLTALGRGSAKKPWLIAEPVATPSDAASISMPLIAKHLRGAFDDADKVSFCRISRGWPVRWWPFNHPLSYFGTDGGAGIGSGPGMAVGIALATHQLGRYPVAVLGDGDFLMGASAIWTAARHKIPLLVIINNNRSYYNDELHQEQVAVTRERPGENRWIGQRLSDPDVDIAKLCEAYGAIGIGPIKEASALAAALRRGAEVVMQGGVCVVDVHTDPALDSGSTGDRKHG
jgi:thiamine pyrophosphate-dependent acetolactate synthase large subunit-like protein